MNVASRMIAIVGPNEAGKSSFLKALEHLNNRTGFVKSGPGLELTRGRVFNDSDVIVEATFALQTDDLAAIAEIENTEQCRWLVLKKTVSGSSNYRILPRPGRSLTLRRQIISRLHSVLPEITTYLEEDDEGEGIEFDFEENITSLLNELGSESDDLGTLVVNRIRNLSSNFRSSGIAARIEELQAVAIELDELAENESFTPIQRAGSILLERMPEFRMFGDDERNLKAEYEFGELRIEVPIALGNLLRVAELDFARLLQSVDEKDAGEIETTISKANKKLRYVFSESWSQSKVSVHLRVDNESLYVLINEDDDHFVQIAERSDGLRQYVALLSFVRLQQATHPPILLIDEAETHLHYDAQADLVQMLTRQNLVAKVIYTTHSIGCMPEDLGMGVRIIEKFEDSSSRIQNWFWASEEAGFSPLLFGMGAQTLAFIPVRYAVIVEGASDMIMLPSLFRSVAKRSYLGFQIVPGLSEANNDALIQLERSSPRTAYLTDSDRGGKAITSRLTSQGIVATRLFSLPELNSQGCVAEDFVDPDIYVEAINKELQRSHGAAHEITAGDLPDNNRPEAVKNWCSARGIDPPNKRAIAYHVVESRSKPDLVDSRWSAELESLLNRIQAELGV